MFTAIHDSVCITFMMIKCVIQTAELIRKYAEKRLKEEKEMRELVQQVADGHKNSKAAKAKLHDIKQRIGTKSVIRIV